MCGDEVLSNREAFTVAGDNRAGDNFTTGVGDQPTHTGDVSDLQPVTTSTRGDHAVDGVVLREGSTHFRVNFLRGSTPDLNEFASTLNIRDQTLVVLRLNLVRQLLVLGDDLFLVLGREHIRKRHGHTRASSPVETGILDAVQGFRHGNLGVALSQVVHQRGNQTLVGNICHPGVIRGHQFVEQSATQ